MLLSAYNVHCFVSLSSPSLISKSDVTVENYGAISGLVSFVVSADVVSAADDKLTFL